MAIHQHFRPLLDPRHENSWFAMNIEWTPVGDERALVIKQAGPYSFGRDVPTASCDFYAGSRSQRPCAGVELS